jgi:hypothetical protein
MLTKLFLGQGHTIRKKVFSKLQNQRKLALPFWESPTWANKMQALDRGLTSPSVTQQNQENQVHA